MPTLKSIAIKICLLFGIFMCSSVLMSQNAEYIEEEASDEDIRMSFAEFSIDRIFPIGTFKTNLDRKLTGATFSYLYQLKKDKMDFAGFQINYARIGGISSSFGDFDVLTGSSIVGVQGLFRHFPNFYFWKIEPFIEVEFGPQFFYTQTTTSFFDEGVSDDIDFDEFDTSIMYGIGGGFTLHITGQVFFMSKWSFIGGTSVTYLVDGDNIQPFPLDNFRPETTQTNYLKWRIGLTVSM